MSAFIKRYKAKNGATVIQVVYKHGRDVTKTVHIGTGHTDSDIELLVALARMEIRGNQLDMGLYDDPEDTIGIQTLRSYSRVLYDALGMVYRSLGFECLGDEVFKQLVLARIIEPSSKADTIRILSNLGLDVPSNTGIHRCLGRVIEKDYRSALSACCFDKASSDSLTLLLYDVTTLYFEIQKEDAYRKSGMSKERRLEPQITVGLLVGRDGFPLEVRSFEGNKAEVKTIMEVLEAFKGRYGLDGMTITADAAMLSSANIQALEDAGYHYIIGSRIAKTPYEIAEYVNRSGLELEDGQVFDTLQDMNTGKKTARVKRRVIYQFRKDRASLDLRNIDKLLDKAMRMVEGKSEFKRNRFLKVDGTTKEINHELVAESRLKAGIKGYVTNLDIPPLEVIAAYHQLFEVERSFRMAKSDLQARPIFHHKRDSIEAHLTIVFAALAISRRIQKATGMTIRRFCRTIEPVRTTLVLVNGKERIAEPYLDIPTRKLLGKLSEKCGS